MNYCKHCMEGVDCDLCMEAIAFRLLYFFVWWAV